MRHGPERKEGALSRFELPGFSLRGRLFWVLAARLLTACGDDSKPDDPRPEEGGHWDTRGDGGAETTTCDAECAADGRGQGERWECDSAFDPETGRALLPDEQAALGKYACRKREDEKTGGSGGTENSGPDDPSREECSDTHTRFVPLVEEAGDAGPPVAGTQSRTTGRALCNAEGLDCVSVTHGSGSGGNCNEPIFEGPDAGANCRAQGCD